MNIERVIEETIIALFSDPKLRARDKLALKGGTALRLSEHIDQRLSTDIDFSTETALQKPTSFFNAVKSSLDRHFRPLGFDVIDCSPVHRPRRQKAGDSPKWGGWLFSFKLVPVALRNNTLAQRRRNALVPQGSASSQIAFDISEWEFCQGSLIIRVRGTPVRVYSSTLLILEKLRAICQQHPSYRRSRSKNRARDFFDIYQLVRKHRKEVDFVAKLKEGLRPVFEAKDVRLDLLSRIFENQFLESQAGGFLEVQTTVSTKLQAFDFYVEQLRILVSQIQGP